MVRVRLAPSPTGTLHIGTARTALFNWLFARQQGGAFLLRIEDTDRERSSEEFTDNILEGLQWIGLDWDEDPVIQSHRLEAHKAAIQQLLANGKAYRCYASTTELENMRSLQKAENNAPRYDNRHRNLTRSQEQSLISEGREAVIRFRIDDNEIIEWNDLIRGPMLWRASDLGGDMVIARQAPANQIGDPLYNLAVVVDDATMAISHVIRGEDHIANTAKQLQLYKALNLPVPQFAHTPLILNKENRKLSKRDGVTSINDFRNMGYSSSSLANYMTLLGWSPPKGMSERFSSKEAATVFTLSRVNKAGARFDWDKLNWLNSQTLHELDLRELREQLLPLWINRGWIENSIPETKGKISEQDLTWQIDLCELLKPSLVLLSDGVDQAIPFFQCPDIEEKAWSQIKTASNQLALRELLNVLINKGWDGQEISIAQEILKFTCQATDTKKGILMKSLRSALLGSIQGPDLLTSWSLLARIGKDKKRIRRCILN